MEADILTAWMMSFVFIDMVLIVSLIPTGKQKTIITFACLNCNKRRFAPSGRHIMSIIKIRVAMARRTAIETIRSAETRGAAMRTRRMASIRRL